MYVHSEHTKQLAERLAQSNPKKDAREVFNCTFLCQKYLLAHTGQLNGLPLTSTNWGSFFLKRLSIVSNYVS